jgi:hypothetical protein
MKFIFQIGEGTVNFPSQVSIQLNTSAHYGEFVQALQVIKGVIEAKISEYQDELDRQDILRQEEMCVECDDVVDTEYGI